MKKSYLTVVLALTSLLGLGTVARAQDADKILVTVPFEFVVTGSKTMPPGIYTISHASQEPRSALIIRRGDDSVFLLPMAVGQAFAGRAEFGFEHAGNKYYLSTIETPAGVYTIKTPQAITKLAQSGERITVFTSGN
jgi:hypothetical protein